MPTIALSEVELETLIAENDEYIERTISVEDETYILYSWNHRPTSLIPSSGSCGVTSSDWDYLDDEDKYWERYDLTVTLDSRHTTDEDDSSEEIDDGVAATLLRMLNDTDRYEEIYALNEILEQVGRETTKEERYVFVEEDQ